MSPAGVRLLSRYGLGSAIAPVASYPVVAASATGATDYLTSHTVNLPTGIANGSLVMVCWANGSTQDGTVTFPAGWTRVGDDYGVNRFYVRACDGTEGSSITVTTGNSVRSAYVTLRFTGHYATSPVEGSQTGTTAPSVTASWGSALNKWITTAAARRGTGYTWTAPTNYTGLIQVQTTGTTTAHCTLGVAFRDREAATEQPGAWVNAMDGDPVPPDYKRFGTFAVRPA